jgi:hypothetical protein
MYVHARGLLYIWLQSDLVGGSFVLYLSLSKVRSSARVHRTNVLLSGQNERKACVHVLRVVLNVVTDIIDSSEAPI